MVLPNNPFPHLVQSVLTSDQHRIVVMSPKIDFYLLMFQKIHLFFFPTAQDIVIFQFYKKVLSQGHQLLDIALKAIQSQQFAACVDRQHIFQGESRQFPIMGVGCLRVGDTFNGFHAIEPEFPGSDHVNICEIGYF